MNFEIRKKSKCFRKYETPHRADALPINIVYQSILSVNNVRTY